MHDIQLLHAMIKDSAKLALEHHQDQNQVTLIEPQQTEVSVTIRGIPDDAIVIKADTFKSPDSVFNGAKGECKRADFVIVADTGKKKVILCIEMKATKDSKQEVIQQLAGARCFVAYCREIGKAFWQHQDFLKGYAYRYVSIGHISIAKQKTRVIRQPGAHDRPELMLKIDWPSSRLPFNLLAGRD